MKNTKKLLTLIAGLALFALPALADYERNGNFVTIHPTSGVARTIRLQVVSDRIIRVEQTPATAIPTKKTSLAVVPQKGNTSFSVQEDALAVYVRATGIRATVTKSDGHVAFFDANGKPLLAEKHKEFHPFISPQTQLPETYRPSSPEEIGWGKASDAYILSLDDRTGWSWNVRFDSPDDEAIYGLGQHQSEEMNYKGRNEELFQYNTKVSVPFVVSTAGYGLLWDSYSYGRWGNPSGYCQLGSIFRLYDCDGKPGQLTGTYTDASGHQVVRGEDSLYYENSREVPRLPQGFALNGSHVVYDGFLEAPEAGEYRFILYYAGYVKVWLDGHLVVPERWRTAWNPNAWKFQASMLEGRRTPLRIEWEPDGDVSYCGLRVAPLQDADAQREVSIWAEMDRDMDYYVIAGENIDSIISGYRTLTGKSQVMPKWSLGFWQSRERYKTQEELTSTLSELRRRRIPVDVMVQDWNYWRDDQWGSHEFDPSRYPHPQAMFDSVHQAGARLMISCWPKFYCGTTHYRELDANGWIYRQAVTDSIYDWLGYMGSFYDAYSKGARKMFWQQMDEHLYTPFGKSMDAWWMDASEPNVRDCTPIEYRKLLCGPTALGTSDEYFNAYSIVNADAIYNGQRSANPQRRVFLLTRSGFAGQQRYGTATWSGDIGTRWEDMRAQATAGLNFSMAGIPFWGMDIGGFCVENRYMKAAAEYDATGTEGDDLTEWRELQARWHEMGCFVPLFRTHGQWPLREAWHIAPEGHPAYEAIVAHDRLRYRLMPYLYSMAGWVHFRDYTMMRALPMDFAGQPWLHDIGDQWMFGPSIMVWPVMTYKARSREVTFPEGVRWYDLHTGRLMPDVRTLRVDAPYSRIPLYAPEGAILPVGPELQYATEHPADTLRLYVYAGRDGSFQLYEDEGDGYGYEKGRYTTVDIRYDDAARSLTIGKRQGKFPGMLRCRRIEVVYVTPEASQPFDPEAPASTALSVEYRGDALTLQL